MYYSFEFDIFMEKLTHII